MIRDFREKYNISETDLNNEISNRLSDIDIKLDNNAKNYNLKTINELLVQQKLLTNLKSKMNNNEEVYVRKQQGGNKQRGGFTKKADENALIKIGNKPTNKMIMNLVILDLQSVLKYKPSGNAFVDNKALEELPKRIFLKNGIGLATILYIISDDNWTWDTVIKEIPILDDWTIEERFHSAKGFTDIKNCVKKILTKYKGWIINNNPNTHIYYISRNWNVKKQVSDLNADNKLELKQSTDDKNSYEYQDNVTVQFMDKNNVSTSGNYMDQLPTVRSIRESIKNPEWMSPFLIDKNHFKSLMTRLKEDCP